MDVSLSILDCPRRYILRDVLGRYGVFWNGERAAEQGSGFSVARSVTIAENSSHDDGLWRHTYADVTDRDGAVSLVLVSLGGECGGSYS